MAIAETELTGQVLIAMPGMGDPRFAQSVVYMCAHSSEGAMGLIVNKPVGGDASLAQLVDDLKLDGTPKRNLPLHFGGPVEPERGFVLHSTDFMSEEGTKIITGGIALTTTVEILERLAEGEGPRDALLILGYSGWGPGQLEDEILQNGWLTAKIDKSTIFAPDPEGKWVSALRTIGVDPLSLSTASGRA